MKSFLRKIIKKMKLALPVFLVVLFVVADLSACLPVAAKETIIWPSGPDITAKSAIVIEANTGLILYKKDAYTAYQPANISQLMTALLTVENCALNEIMTMSTDAETKVSGSRVGLTRREQITVESALYAVLLASGNEVAYGLSEHVSTSRDNFVELMNRRAKELGCTNTAFTSPEGADDAGHYTCAYDMALIAREVFKNETLTKITGSSSYTIPATNLKEQRPISNRHQMIKKSVDYAAAKAGKVGYSSVAGYTGVTLLEKDGMKLIVVILNDSSSDNMYKDIKNLGNWCFDNFKCYNIKENELGGNAAFASLFNSASRFTLNETENILNFDDSSSIVVPNGVAFKEVIRTVKFNENSEYFHGENVVGTISYTYGGVFVGSADITYYNDGDPLNSVTFNERWPAFLFTIEEAMSEDHRELLDYYLGLGNVSPTPAPEDSENKAPTVTPTPNPEVENYKSISGFKVKMIVGCGVAVAVILLVLYLLAFEIPYRRKNRDW